ncbi:MAG: LamG domain-containing protein, partial [Solirubrobacterales bacterium]|nr:LamG domain-containing protein [Solirubrobacterales bacterium]
NYSAGGASVAVDWLRLSPYANRNQSIVGHGDGGEIYIKDGYFVYRRMDTSVTSSVAVRPGEWQQVVGTWDGVDIRIYVDGVEAGKVESTKRPSSVSTFYVGYGELAPWFNGSIDEVAYYPVALNTNRVFQHWLADPPPDDLNAATNGVQPDDVSDIHPTPGAGGGTDPSGTSDEPKSDDPGSSDPGSGDPDNPTSDDPSTDDPSGDPGEGADDGTVEPIYEKSDKPKAAANRSKAAKAKKRRAAVRKCKKISKKSKRKACLKRARSI